MPLFTEAMNMPKTDWLITKLTRQYPQFSFCEDNFDHWSSSDQTVYYNPHQPHYEAFLLHELAHGILGHANYQKDIELLSIERQAWQYATSQLAPHYNITIADELIEQALDSYRDWLHAKSACPRCDQTGFQLTSDRYRCLTCQTDWRVNRGIDTAIRRYAAI